jgi:hypothetical protein
MESNIQLNQISNDETKKYELKKKTINKLGQFF